MCILDFVSNKIHIKMNEWKSVWILNNSGESGYVLSQNKTVYNKTLITIKIQLIIKTWQNVLT